MVVPSICWLIPPVAEMAGDDSYQRLDPRAPLGFLHEWHRAKYFIHHHVPSKASLGNWIGSRAAGTDTTLVWNASTVGTSLANCTTTLIPKFMLIKCEEMK